MSILLQHYRRAFQGLPPAVWTISLVLFVHRSGTMVLPFLSLHLKDHLALSATVAALLLSTYGLGSICGSLLGGKLTARFGPVPVMVVGLTLTAPLFLLLLWSDTLLEAVLSMFILSCIGDTVRPAAMTATANLSTPDSMSRAFALNRLAINLGMSLGPAVAGFLYQRHFEWIFYIDAVSCILAAAMLASLLGWRDGRHSLDSTAAEPVNGGAWWRDWTFLTVLLQFSLVMVVFLQSISVYPIYLREQHAIAESTIGLLFSINTVLIVAFEMLLISYLNQRRRLPVIGAGCVLICLGYGVMPFGQGLGFMAATVVIWTLGEMLSMPLLTTWISERVPAAQRSQYLGVSTAAFSCSWVVAPLVGGAMYAVDPNAMWYLALVLGGLACGTFYWVSQIEDRAASSGLPGTSIPGAPSMTAEAAE